MYFKYLKQDRFKCYNQLETGAFPGQIQKVAIFVSRFTGEVLCSDVNEECIQLSLLQLLTIQFLAVKSAI